MIIVLLFFFQSICLYCQRLVLHIHDRWINPKNVRILKEATETVGERKALAEFNARTSGDAHTHKRSKKSSSSSSSTSTAGTGTITTLAASLYSGDDDALAEVESCRFCANSPQGYCRHHFHLQELQVQKQQQKQQRQQQQQPHRQLSRVWNPLCGNAEQQQKQEYRQLRRINRELKRNLKNRLSTQQQQQQQHQHQQQHKQQQQYQQYQAYKCYLRETAVHVSPAEEHAPNTTLTPTPTITTPTPSADSELSLATHSTSSGYQSGCNDSDDITPTSACTTYYFDAGEAQAACEQPNYASLSTETSSIVTTYL